MKLVHWLHFTQAMSGLYSYVYALHKASLELGIDSHICYWDSSLKDGATLKFPDQRIGIVKASPWTVKDGAINITHDQIPLFKLDNWVGESHGVPEYTARDFDALTTNMYKLDRAEIILCSSKSAIPYWEMLTDKPIYHLDRGVDLDYWKPEGKKMGWTRPMILWADTWREPVKNPINLLYAMKIINRELPMYALKMCAVPSDRMQMVAYMCGRLRLDSVIEWPLEHMVQNIDQYYRGAEAMYSDTNEEGSNASWEAEACGLPVVHHKDTPEEIAKAIIEQANKHERKVIARDIKNTARQLLTILGYHFSSL